MSDVLTWIKSRKRKLNNDLYKVYSWSWIFFFSFLRKIRFEGVERVPVIVKETKDNFQNVEETDNTVR